MLTHLDTRIGSKSFTWFGILIERDIFSFTFLWYYKERYDKGVGLLRFSIGRLIEYKDRNGVVVESLGFSWEKLRRIKCQKN